MKFASSLLAAAFFLSPSAAYAGSDDGTPDRQAQAQSAAAQAPAPAAAGASRTEVYSGFEHQAARP